MSWTHVVTRIFALFEIWMATETYPKLPLKDGGFNLDNIVLGKDGIIDRYLDQDQFLELQHIIKTTDFSELVQGFVDYEKTVLPFFEKDPLENRIEFIKIFRELWIHEITAFYVGLYTTDEKLIEMLSHLRGTQSAQHIAVTHFLPKLFEQIADMKGMDVEILKYVLPEEILSLDINPDVLAERRKQYIIETVGGKMKLIVGKEAEKYAEEFLKENTENIDTDVTEFKGNIAFKGSAKGVAVLVRHEKDLDRVKEGSILVSPMTRTSFLPAMQKAAAFITDEGGVTCHAAIVARELKKPCIVGTKIATKVLKDGDMIEVDAEKGIVRILKR